MARTSQKRADGVLLLTKLALECAKIRLAAARRGRNERADGVHGACSSAISRGTAEELDVGGAQPRDLILITPLSTGPALLSAGSKMKVAVALVALSALVGAFVPHPGARLHRPPSTAMAGVADDRIDELVKANKIMLFMKGTKMFPQCGFSNTVVQVLTRMGVEFETFDVLSDDAIRQGIKEYSNWPTIPQLYLDGEFVGGCDIVIEQYQNGELQEAIEIAMAS